MRTIHRTIVAGLVISDDGKFLFGKKDPNGGGVYADCWHTPGGGVEDNETKLQALQREMAEELGIDITSANIELLDDQGTGQSKKTLKTGETVICKMTFNVYQIHIAANVADIVVQPGDDLKSFMWVSKSDLATIKLTPPSLDLFIRLGWLN